MNLKQSLLTLTACLSLSAQAQTAAQPADMHDVITRGLHTAIAQSKQMAAKLLEQKEALPHSVTKDDHLRVNKASDWTSGFFPGLLWYLYEASGEDALRDYAREYTSRIEDQQYNTRNHDVGFMLYCSYGNGWRLTGDEHYRRVLVQGAQSLGTRFDPKVGCTRSWDRRPWQYPVIIDNMMNLELLLWASKHGGPQALGDMARSHADVTMRHHFRPDYSTYHVVSYDTITGRPEQQCTYQGYADHSAWARGQAWALYGYTMMYRETGHTPYLEQAKGVARFLLTHPRMPEDKVPYWDFDDPAIPRTPRDASAAAVMASALIELSTYVDRPTAEAYLATAATQLRTLTSPEYLAEPGTNHHFVLKHSVSNKPKSKEVDKPLTYADYYYVEALLRYWRDVLHEPLPAKL